MYIYFGVVREEIWRCGARGTHTQQSSSIAVVKTHTSRASESARAHTRAPVLSFLCNLVFDDLIIDCLMVLEVFQKSLLSQTKGDLIRGQPSIKSRGETRRYFCALTINARCVVEIFFAPSFAEVSWHSFCCRAAVASREKSAMSM